MSKWRCSKCGAINDMLIDNHCKGCGSIGSLKDIYIPENQKRLRQDENNTKRN